MKRLVLPVVLLAVIVLGVTLALRPSDRFATAASGAPAVRLGTPILSPRRIAPALVALRAQSKLQKRITTLLADPALAGWTKNACLTVAVGATTVLDVGGDKPVIPASTNKLLTATAALGALGADRRFRTEVRAAAPPVKGVVAGDLVLVGGGDPLLETDAYAATHERQPVTRTRIEDLAQAVKAAGVTEIRGSVVGDETRFDTQRAIPTWKASYGTSGEVGPLSALLVNDGFDPPGKQVASPAAHAAGVLTTLLEGLGVTVSGSPRAGSTGGTAVVAFIDSPPLSDVIGEMLRESDNTTAEVLVKELAHTATGKAGTTTDGVTAARDALGKAGIDVSPISTKDGSGLDRGDRVTCRALEASLAAAGRSSTLADGLSVAATNGTLEKRFVGTAAAGRLRAKTGTLDGVSALAGFVDPPTSSTAPPVVFSLVSNDIPKPLPPQTLGDRLGVALATWPEAPAVDQLLPLPTTSAAP